MTLGFAWFDGLNTKETIERAIRRASVVGGIASNLLAGVEIVPDGETHLAPHTWDSVRLVAASMILEAEGVESQAGGHGAAAEPLFKLASWLSRGVPLHIHPQRMEAQQIATKFGY